METSTLGGRRSWIIRAFGRNPLVRTSDRVEALLLVFTFAAVLLFAPVAGAIGTAVHESRSHLYAEESRNRHLVTATVVEETMSTIEQTRLVVTAPVRWRVDGVDHVDTLLVDPSAKVGHRLDIWVDGEGKLVAAPASRWQAGIDALIAGAASWLAVMFSAAGLLALLRAGLARRRAVGWDRELRGLADDAGGRTGSQT